MCEEITLCKIIRLCMYYVYVCVGGQFHTREVLKRNNGLDTCSLQESIASGASVVKVTCPRAKLTVFLAVIAAVHWTSLRLVRLVTLSSAGADET